MSGLLLGVYVYGAIIGSAVGVWLADQARTAQMCGVRENVRRRA